MTSCVLIVSPSMLQPKLSDGGEYPLAAKIAVMSNEESQGGLILAASPSTKKSYGVKLGTRRYEIQDQMDIEMVEPRMADYIKKNEIINKIYRQFTDDQHWYPYSIDESFIDVTHSHELFGSNEEIAEKIQNEVFAKTGIITTVGIGENPLLAKLALDNEAKYESPFRAKWTYDRVPETLWNIKDLTSFWSIGAKTALKLNNIGIFTIKELAHADRRKLHDCFGSWVTPYISMHGVLIIQIWKSTMSHVKTSPHIS